MNIISIAVGCVLGGQGFAGSRSANKKVTRPIVTNYFSVRTSTLTSGVATATLP